MANRRPIVVRRRRKPSPPFGRGTEPTQAPPTTTPEPTPPEPTPAESAPSKVGLSELNPPGYEQKVFAPITLPDTPFMLNNVDTDEEDGPYDPDLFMTDPVTNIAMVANDGMHPVYLRSLEQADNRLVLVDGEGYKWNCEIRPLTDTLPAAEDPFTPPDQIRAYEMETSGN